MPFTQTDRLMSVHTPLGEDALILNGFSGNESISQLPKFDLDLLREGEPIPFQDIIGQQVTIKLVMSEDETRYFNGFISRFAQTGSETGIIHYRAEMVPWLWFLTRTADCRIFQNKTVPEIIEQIFADLGFSDYELHLEGTYQPREYCVQYRETDYSFVARLMEQYGLFYFFTHEEDKHMLIVGDSPAAHPDHLGPETVSWEPTAHALEEDVITSLTCEKDLRPGNFSHTDYNFTTPNNNLMAEEPSVVDIGGNSQYQIYDYPGEYKNKNEGAALARIRMQEIEAQHFLLSGRSTCRGFSAGAKFTLSDYFPLEMNQAYLLTSVQHVGSMGTTYSTSSAGGSGGEAYTNSFSGIPLSVPFRPRQRTPKPIVQGPQTAKVVGPSGETIWPDEYGRVKVQFHWDREGENDDNSSCWVQVSQYWAGQNWGSMHIPHINQEVIVNFLEGDPDRPIITGRVYNAEQVSPLDLPGSKTQSIVRDQGGNETKIEGEEGKQSIHTTQTCGNEFLMDGTSGGEKIELRDKYGNEVVLDAVAGTITLYSPSHETKMVLGKSFNLFTQSDYHSENDGNSTYKTLGDTKWDTLGQYVQNVVGPIKIECGADITSFFVGFQHDTVLISRTEFTGGFKNESTLGALTEFVKGAKIEVHKGVEYNHAGNGQKENKTNFRSMLGETFRTVKAEKQIVKADKKIKVAGEMNTKADKLLQEAEELINNSNGDLKQMSKGATKQVAGTKLQQKASTIEAKADLIKEKAQKITLAGSKVKIGG